MIFRDGVLVHALGLGILLVFPIDLRAQTNKTAPSAETQQVPATAGQGASPTSTPTPSEQQGQGAPPPSGAATQPADQGTAQESSSPGSSLPPVVVVQPKPKPKPKPPVVAEKPKLKPKTVTARPPAPTTPAQAPIAAESDGSVETAASTVPMSPVPGAEIPIGHVPSGVSIVTGSDFARQYNLDTPEQVLQQRVPGVIVQDLQGNSFQTDVQFRGFESSPVNGVPQGLAVYQNGVRINEAFGDIVNYDFLPDVAISNMTVLSNNPVYGLNALGGAISITMKDGFLYQGAEVTGAGGSFDRAQGSAQAGLQSGHWAAYFGGERIHDDGWRQFSPAEIKRMYADLGFKNTTGEFHLNFTGADNFVGVTAAAPVQLLGVGWNKSFTSPQTTDNKVAMTSVNGTINVTDNLSFNGVGYYRIFKQSHQDGNIGEFDECEDPNIPGTICLQGEQVLDATGNPIDFDITASPLGSLDSTSQDAKSWGTADQAVYKGNIFNRSNQFLVGASYDHGHVDYNAGSELGFFIPNFVVKPLGIDLEEPDDITPRDLSTTNDYVGVYFTDTFNLSDRLSLTAGGRYNFAQIKIEDLTGNFPDLNGTNTYTRFNPMGGATYKLFPDISLYGGYSEANRAPVAAELACSDPTAPCLIESFLTADPPLKQVVSHTWELGVRGEKASGPQKLEWSLGYFHTLNTDDIITVFSALSGRGFFANGGDTLRQGVEANISYRNERWFYYANYAFVDATFESPLVLPSPNNPLASPCPVSDSADTGGEEATCVFVQPGDHLPGIPQHRFKFGVDYWITPKWKFGGDLLAVSSQFFFGDESNLNDPLGGYTTVNLHTSYDVLPSFQLYGLINNLFDRHYGVFGNFFNLDGANSASAVNPSTGPDFFTNARTITPAAPFAVYGGAKIKFF
jgi:iron complex outermembrane recepter protein